MYHYTPQRRLSLHTDAQTSQALAAHLPLSLTQITRLILELLEKSGGLRIKEPERMMEHCRLIIQLGAEAEKRMFNTVTFRDALDETLKCKAHRAKMTLRDIKYYMKKLLEDFPSLSERPLRDMTTQECAIMLETTFLTPTQRKKARAILSGIFNVGRRRGWCNDNPVTATDIPHVKENTILPLSIAECRRLLETVAMPTHKPCAPALGLMLWAGIRPQEVTRLTWNDIDFEEKEVVIPARHSKTGGGRHIPLCPALLKLLKLYCPKTSHLKICPKNWKVRWLRLRRSAGFRTWRADVLRHTFASFHAKKYHNLTELQLYMGHRNTTLLLNRYINMKGISRKDALDFWNMTIPPKEM